MLWGVGPKTSARLNELGIHTIGDIANAGSRNDTLFGENGRELSLHARGMDERPITTERETKSISQEITFARDVRDDKSLEKTLREQAAGSCAQLRKNNLAGTTIKLKMRWPDFTTLTRQTTLSQPDRPGGGYTEDRAQFNEIRSKAGQAVRLIGVGVSGLGPPVRQLSLWDAGSEKSRAFAEAVDALKEKYGDKVIQRGEEELNQTYNKTGGQHDQT